MNTPKTNKPAMYTVTFNGVVRTLSSVGLMRALKAAQTTPFAKFERMDGEFAVYSNVAL